MKTIRKKFILIIISAFFLAGCSSAKEVQSDMYIDLSAGDIAVGVNPFMDSWSSFEYGILMGNEGRLKIYDYESGQSYVLCGDSNCKHKDESCPAYFSALTYINGAAVYNGKICYFEDDSTEFRLCTQSVTGDQKKVLWKQRFEDVSVGKFTLSGISKAIYHNGFVWGEFQYIALLDAEGTNVINTSVVKGIQLDTGNVVELTKLPEIEDGFQTKDSRLVESSEILYAGEGTVIVDSSCPVSDTGYKDTYILYDIESEKKEVIHESERVPILNGSEIVGYMPEIEILGKYKDDYVCTLSKQENPLERGNDRALYLYDPRNDSFKTLAENLYGFPFFEARRNINSLIDNSKLLYAVLQDNMESVDVYCYDLETGSAEKAFQDTKSLEHRLFDQTSEMFVVKVYSNDSGMLAEVTNEGYKTYLISKEDYLQGNFDAKKEIVIK